MGDICNNDFKWVENWIKSNLWEVRRYMGLCGRSKSRKLHTYLDALVKLCVMTMEIPELKMRIWTIHFSLLRNLFTHPVGLNWWFSSFFPPRPCRVSSGHVSKSQHEQVDLGSIFRLAFDASSWQEESPPSSSTCHFFHQCYVYFCVRDEWFLCLAQTTPWSLSRHSCRECRV